MRLIFAPLALADLEEIGDYSALDNPPRALSFHPGTARAVPQDSRQPAGLSCARGPSPRLARPAVWPILDFLPPHGHHGPNRAYLARGTGCWHAVYERVGDYKPRPAKHEGWNPLVFPGDHFDSLDKSPFGKRHRARSGHDEMVENPHVDQGQRLFEVLRQQFIGTARFRYSRGVVMRKHDCGGIARQGVLHHLARVD